MHQIAFIFIIPGVAVLTSWMQKVLKIVENSSQNGHKKYEARCCIGQKHAPSTNLRKYIETHSFLSLPMLLCSRHACKIAQKSENLHTKNPKHIGSTHQNRVKCWIRSIQNQRNSFKIPFALARSLRSCPPRGGPIRSVFYYMEK